MMIYDKSILEHTLEVKRSILEIEFGLESPY